jgi:DNA-binding NtrC family response regulator
VAAYHRIVSSESDDRVTIAKKQLTLLASSAERAGIELAFHEGGRPRSADVPDAPLTIGSAEGVGLRLDDPSVSRLHAETFFREGALWVRDLGSRNGTYVDGVLVETARLRDGTRLYLSNTEVFVRASATPKKVELWPGDRFGPLRGQSVAMRALFGRLARLSKTASTVLIHGETGSGKELVARAIHDASPRRGGPFVTVDCTSIPESLFESELFGHAKGAFTGAHDRREGALEAASGGTLFLDELGELPASVQPKLLRAIESRTIKRVGETKERPIDLRFVAATHRDLGQMVNVGAFREDLYFRLAVLVVEIPPLRARREDVGLLLEHFLGEAESPFTPEHVSRMAERPWLGNVRELRNFVERAIALGPEEAFSAPAPRTGTMPSSASLPLPDVDRPFKDVRDDWMAHLEREYVRAWLQRRDGNVTAVAEAIGLDRSYIHRLIKKHGLAR